MDPNGLFLIGLGIGSFFDFLPRAVILAGASAMTVSVYQHINVRFNTPRWWRFIFNTVEHHSVHHSQDYEASRCNYSGTWILWDRLFCTCVDGEAEVLGMEGGRRMHIGKTMVFPFGEGWRTGKATLARRFGSAADQGGQMEPAESAVWRRALGTLARAWLVRRRLKAALVSQAVAPSMD